MAVAAMTTRYKRKRPLAPIPEGFRHEFERLKQLLDGAVSSEAPSGGLEQQQHSSGADARRLPVHRRGVRRGVSA